jgi:hypothetical protein
MEEQLLELLEGLIDGRNDFFTHTMRITPHASRPQLISRYMLNEVCILELIHRVYQNHLRSSTVVTLSLPANFSDPVVVAPTQEQINTALEDIPTSTSNCAICQDAISSGACRIRHCRHEFHRSCLTSWLGLSVRCPVCRHDIRESNSQSGASSQTPSDEE